MLAEERRSIILDILTEKGSVSVVELARRLRVSGETIRRDISLLDQQNRLQKTHGGALSSDSMEPAFSVRMAANPEGKQFIGKKAAELVPDGASVIIDYGTTAYYLAEALLNHSRLTIFTSSIPAAMRLAGRNSNRVLILGGEYQSSEGTTLGSDALSMLGHYVADFAFIGAGAISKHPWLLDYSREAADLRGQMISLARTPVVLADCSKFGRLAPVRIANFEQVTHIITDRRPDEAMVKALSNIGAELWVADPPKGKIKKADKNSQPISKAVGLARKVR